MSIAYRSRPGLSPGFCRMLLPAVLLTCSLPGGAQPAAPPEAPDPDAVTQAAIDALAGQIQAAEQLDEEARNSAQAALTQASALVKQAQQAQAEAARLAQLAEQSDEQVAAIQARRQDNPFAELQEVPEADADDIPALQRQLTALQTREQTFQAEQTEAASRVAALTADRTQLPKRIAQLQQQIGEVREALATQADPARPALVVQVEQLRRRARLEALQAQLGEAQTQLNTLDSRLVLRQGQEKLAADRLAQVEKVLPVWQQALTAAEEAKARREIAESRQKERQAEFPLEKQLRERNTALARMSNELTARQGRLAGDVEAVSEQIEAISEDFAQARFMEQQQGLSGQVGRFLRRQKQDLDTVRQIRRRWQEVQQQRQQAQQRLLELEKELASLRSVEDLADQSDLTGPRRQELIEALTAARAETKSKLESLTDAYPAYVAELRNLENLLTEKLALVEQFRDYIDQRVLWVRSTEPLGLGDLQIAAQAAWWLVQVDNWTGLGEALAADAAANPAITAIGVLLLGGLLVGQARARKRLLAINQRVAGQYPGTFRDTVYAALLTLTLAAFWPVLLGFVGWRLTARPQAPVFAYAIGAGLLLGALASAPIHVMRQTARKKGLAETHFRWPENVLRRIAAAMLKVLAVGLPLVVLIGVMQDQPDDAWRRSLGRLASIVGLVLLTIFLARLLNPRGPLIQETIAKRKNNWMFRLRKVWYPLVLLLPLSLAGAAAAGYYYTTIQLSARLLTQAWIVIVLILINALLLRWILLGRRRLAMAEIARRREAQQQRKQREQDGELPPDAPPELEEAPVDLSAVNVQTRQFVRYLMAAVLLVSIWMIWADVLPALGILDRVELWSSGEASITLATLLGAIFVVVLTVVLSRNLPGMTDIIMLQRLQLDSGSRFAINAIFRYTILVVGFVMAFQTIGLKWSHIQWLVAAMTVGLGFGLQEIFANFVSGLIILLERPIRVGDIVTVGEITGTVSRIRMRATTITDWDRKELIVPNKEFITAQLVNWTLSDNVIRVVVPVGIAYGSDTAKAMKILREVADANARVLDDPEPMILFMGFGASSLDFELRAYVGGLRDFLAGRSELHFEVDQAFRAAEIEIAFPQRDIHVRSIHSALPIETDKALRIMEQRTDLSDGTESPGG